MKNKNIVYGIIAVLVILGILFIFNKNEEKTEIKKNEKTEVLEIKDGKSEVKNVTKNEVSETLIVEDNISKDNNISENKTNEESKSPVFLKKEYVLVSSEDVPDDFADIHNLPTEPGPENDLTLLGVDANENGIRDDLERIITYSLRDNEQLKEFYLASAARRFNDHKLFERGNITDEEFKNHRKNLRDYLVCESYYEDKYLYSSLTSKISKINTNTKKRWEANNEFGSMNNEKVVKELYNGMHGIENEPSYKPVASEKFCQDFINKYRN